MREVIFVLMTACAFAGCAGAKDATSTTTLTAAEIKPPARNAVYANPGPPVDRRTGIDQWRGRYPHAARVLDDWVASYSKAAPRVIAWSNRNPEQFEVFVFWSATNRFSSAGAFLVDHPSWEELGAITRDQPIALDALMNWARDSKAAALELAVHYGGFGEIESIPIYR